MTKARTGTSARWVLAPLMLVLVATSAMAADLPDFTGLVEKYGPAVVNVQASGNPENQSDDADDQEVPEIFKRFFGPGAPIPRPHGGGQRVSMGSGFVISADGYVLTNNHVVDGAENVTVTLSDRRVLDAKVVGSDAQYDIALLKLTATNLPVVSLGDSKSVKAGQWVVAIGSPFGFDHSVTAGIVSAVGRNFGGADQQYVPFIQTDVPINRGNSGGPLFNLEGQVVGINSQIFSNTGSSVGISFAIPINIAMSAVEQLKATGHVARGMIGVQIQNVDQGLADSFGLPQPEGALVSSVEKGGAAERAGIEPGDVILKLNGDPVNQYTELPAVIAGLQPGTVIKLEVWRQHATREISVKLAEMEDRRTASNSENAQEGGKLGLAVRPLTSAEQRQANTQGGLLVEQAKGPAASAGLQQGDIVLAANGAPVSTIAQLRAAVEKSKSHIALLVQRGDARLFIPVRVG